MTRPVVYDTIEGLRAAMTGRQVALVPTMGALHAGHLSLVERAAELSETVVVSIFVNPLQFGANEDLDRYPRDLDGDLTALASCGFGGFGGFRDIRVFAPSVAEMYPTGAPSTRVVGGTVTGLFEGRSRPGHFDGMLTVVAKLLTIVSPEVAIFGQKDAQQLFLIQRMVADLNLPVRIVPGDTQRDSDGLALSSRNRFLDPAERAAAPALHRALEAAQAAAERGLGAAIAAAQAEIMNQPLIDLDYLEVVDPASFLPVGDDHRGPARVLIAARLGSTRLIDNEALYLNRARP